MAHRLRNLRSKAPETVWAEIAARARGCYMAASPALAAVLRDDFVAAYERELPAVVQCFGDDFEACIAHLRFPLRHRRVIGTTNLLERLFLEERRRTKIIPHALRRAARAEADVRGGHPDRRSLAWNPGTDTPKSGHGRTVDMSQQLAKTLRRLQLDREQEKLRRRWSEMPPWVFVNDKENPLDGRCARRSER